MAEDDYSIDEEVDPLDQAATTLDIIRRMREEEAALPTTLPTAAPPQPAPTPAAPPIPSGFTRADFPLGMPSQMPEPFTRSVQVGRPADVPMTAAVPGPVDMRSLLLMQQYEANEGYRRDVSQGMNQSDAMAKWGPTMFTSRTGTGMQPRYMNVGGRLYQVGLGGVSAPLTPEVKRPQYRNVGGQLFEVGAEGPPRAVTPEPMSRTALQDRAYIIKRMGNIQAMLDADQNLPNANQLLGELAKLQRQKDALDSGTRTGVSPPAAAAPMPAPIPPVSAKRRRGGSKEKLARAEELRQQYPDASKSEILDMVRAEFD